MLEINDIINTIIQGNVLDRLKQIPSESINMVITSPPYWGLRNYNTNPQIWDGDNDCEHDWDSFIKKGITGGIKSEKVNTKGQENFQIVQDSPQQICIKCGAWKGELGSEPTYELYIKHLCDIFDEVKRILTNDGTCWVNLGDSYAGSNQGTNYMTTENHKSLLKDCGIQSKSLVGIPDRFKISMIDNGWICRNDIIWHKPNAMPESVKDRFTADYERIFFFVKNKKYHFEQQKEKCVNGDPNPPRGSKGNKVLNSGLRKQDQLGKNNYTGFNDRCTPKEFRNVRSVWNIATQPLKDAHFATFPEKLLEVPIRAGCPENGIVMDIFMGSGTTAIVSNKNNRNYIGIELNPEYIKIAENRIKNVI